MALQSDTFSHKKNTLNIFVLQKKYTRLLTFSDYHEHTNLLFKSFNISKPQGTIQFSLLKFIYFYFNH